MTAFLSFVPKTSGIVALIKLLYVVGGGELGRRRSTLAKLLWVLAVLTMTVGNVLGLLQIQREARARLQLDRAQRLHAGRADGAGDAGDADDRRATCRQSALQGVLFYLAAYGIMNAGAFGVLMLLPRSRLAPADPCGTATPPPDHAPRPSKTSPARAAAIPGSGWRWPCAASA